MNIRIHLWRGLLAAVLASAATLTVWADAPGRVARLSSFVGNVQLANEREDWRPIPRNYAVTAGDNLWVSEGGRAELDVGPVQLWLAGGSNVVVERLDDQSLIARLSQGSMAVRIRTWEQQDAMRVLTADGEVAFLQPGFYVLNAASQYAPTSLNVRIGQAEVLTIGPGQIVNRGDSVVLDGSGVRFDRNANYANNSNGGFEVWAVWRDRRNDRWESRNAGQLSPWMVGARDLDEYGNWDNDYEYGRIWYPTAVAADWAPYRNGRWSWVQPWGWTWVDDAAWGFAPFHYGRWVRVGPRWAWSPGSSVGRPVYAPALVTFFGGNGWSFGASVGPSYSWLPLGWNEPYVPWYTYSPTYWRQVNRPYVRNIAEEPWRPRNYLHATVPGAITAVAGAAFIGGRPVAQNLLRNISERDIRSAPPARMGEVLPQFQSGRGNTNANVNVNGSRPVDPNPVVGRPQTVPVRERSMPPGVVQPAAPPVNAAPFAFAPNTNVTQPRVWQDPNPIVNRQQLAPARPTEATQPRQLPPFGSENPGLRAPATPMPKDLRERAIQRGEVLQPSVAPAPYTPPAAPRLAEQRSIPIAPTSAPPRAVEPRPAAPVQAAQPAPVVDRGREQPRAMPATEAPRSPREKDRALTPPREQP
ncbi:MAG: hypothetical protein H7203_09430 [Rhizobacter sp.]|nr:hypothetical protein [Burkholderiales bacterium]